MRTAKANIIFHDSFILDRGVGELSAGTYDIEIDEEEILATDRTGYRRTVIYLFVENHRSTRSKRRSGHA